MLALASMLMFCVDVDVGPDLGVNVGVDIDVDVDVYIDIDAHVLRRHRC